MDNENYIFCSRCGKKILSQRGRRSNNDVVRRCPYCDEFHSFYLSKTNKANAKKN